MPSPHWVGGMPGLAPRSPAKPSDSGLCLPWLQGFPQALRPCRQGRGSDPWLEKRSPRDSRQCLPACWRGKSSERAGNPVPITDC